MAVIHVPKLFANSIICLFIIYYIIGLYQHSCCTSDPVSTGTGNQPSVGNQLLGPTQPGHPFMGRHSEHQQKLG